MTPELTAAVSVIRDGATAWVCRVEWSDGQTVTREVGSFFVAGMPEVVLTQEVSALDALETWVRARPQDWRDLIKLPESSA